MPKIFLVGGVIRDRFLGVESKDFDYTFVLDDLDKPVEQGFSDMTKYMKKKKYEIFLSTPECFTIRARFPKGSKNEKLVADFVMARKEIGYVDGTRLPILKLGTLEDDLVRRDFTVNAIAEDEHGRIIDLFNGLDDIRDGILRTPLDPNITLLDDPLRLLRALRFSVTKNFIIHHSIWTATEENEEILNKLEKVVSPERIREEIFKMLKFDTIKSMLLLMEADRDFSPEKDEHKFLRIVFGNGMWLKPTFEH